MSVNIKSAEIDASTGTEVIINNNSLLNAIVQNNEDALQFLRDQVGPVYMADLSVDNQGRVVIKNKAFAQQMQKKLSGGGIGAAGSVTLGGWGCGGGCVNI